ncbi:gamma-glutamyltransferase [Natronolimnohabitans innermongolicus]|uniref:Gamma-glutamyltransferase n=1 Tax=Natronolimnohabitans innermongolicus JCM 12255 TaxID=1227499 RepID=L9WL48_9EURY|nr:gamma-glutamyltransferase [Natronolimnohabitans innermongolicus]ELY50189.1 gamma-glutamyltransferase [Natronolimnohabitans innermongolicus JCM 12255]
MITTPHTLASSTGLDVLRSGGSAVDAAIAANATLCVAYPHMAGLGGDGFWLLADGNNVTGINASGPAAANATRASYRDRGLESIPDRGSESALTVPGAIDGWRLAHEEYGSLSWERLFEDAIQHAREGVAVTANLARWIALDRDVLADDPRAAATFLSNGDAPTVGATLRQPALAASLERIAHGGARDGFYDGQLAIEFCTSLDEESPLTATDFSEYSAEWVTPLDIEYGNCTAHSLPPNSQGLAALQILGLLDGFDVESWGDGTVDYYHHLAEAVKVAFADRDAWITDPDSIQLPAETLLSSSYLEDRRALIGREDTLPADLEPGIAPETTQPVSEDAGGDTCYLSVVDSDGLAVSLIQSIYYDFGSGVIAGDTGIIPQNRGSFFSLDPNHINRLEPRKRTFHTLTPAMLTEEGDPRLVYGTMGGEGQPQTQAALVTRLLDFEYDVQQAIEAPRWLFGRTWGEASRSLTLEGRIPDPVVTGLEKRGHPVAMGRNYDDTMGHAAAIRRHDDGSLEGGSDPRSDGAAIGY